MRDIKIIRYAFAVALLVVAGCRSEAPGPAITPTAPPAASLISEALKTAKVEDKAVMLEFRADWCKWCARLDTALRSPEIGGLFHDNYVVVKLTVQESEDKVAFENPGAQEILNEVGAGEAGIPVVVFLDKEGNRIGNSLMMRDGGNIGYPVTPEEIEAFDALLAKTAPRMTATDRTAVKDWLTRNAPKV
jgi:thioredoxin-related protein